MTAMAINGAHVIVYSTNADADREFFRDVLSLPDVDVGGGWLIFGLPPSEVAVHPVEAGEAHELYLMCPDIEAFMSEMGQRNIACNPVQDQGWGLVTQVILPGGGKLGVYQPRHARPPMPGDGSDGVRRPRSARRPRPAAGKATPKTRAKAKTTARTTPKTKRTAAPARKKAPAKKKKR
jgi:hypothetical protein